MLGDSTDALWGVADIIPRTDFPDIRKKAVIKSAAGTLVLIPREGDALVRLYLEMPPNPCSNSSNGSSNGNGGQTSNNNNNTRVTEGDLRERARLIFRPYEMEVAETRWWSAYSVGQRLAERFCDVGDDGDDFDARGPARARVLLLGDAAHTHSPKAGQGMNVSLQDGYNVGWKLGAHLTGRAGAGLVGTYVGERRATAAELIEFDRRWSKIFRSDDGGGGEEGEEEGEKKHASYVRDQFVQAGRYTAGQAYKYGESIIVWPGTAGGTRGRASKLVVGMRFPSAQVVRFSDARVYQLLSLLRSDGRWRVVVFDGDIQDEKVRSRLNRVGASLEGLVTDFTPDGDDVDSFIEPLLVLKSRRTEVDISQLPEAFKPITGPYKIRSESRSGNKTSKLGGYESDFNRSTQSILRRR